MEKYDLLLFDADETLFDYTRSAKEALSATLESYGLPCPENVWALYKARNDQVWEQLERGERDRDSLMVDRYRMLFADLGAEADAAAFNRDYMTRLGQGGYALPGAEALCKALFPYYPLYIVTNGSTATQLARMERSPLKPYIRKLYISQQVGYQKPRREFFDAVLADLGVTDRSRVLLIGDSLTSDMAGGIGAGIPVCWYNPAHQDAGGMQPDFEIHTLPELLPIVL